MPRNFANARSEYREFPTRRSSNSRCKRFRNRSSMACDCRVEVDQEQQGQTTNRGKPLPQPLLELALNDEGLPPWEIRSAVKVGASNMDCSPDRLHLFLSHPEVNQQEMLSGVLKYLSHALLQLENALLVTKNGTKNRVKMKGMAEAMPHGSRCYLQLFVELAGRA